MSDNRRTTSYTAPLANGRTRNQLVRFFVSSPPDLFARVRARAERTGLPLTVTASDLLERGLQSLGDDQ